MKIKELQELIKDLPPEAEIIMTATYSHYVSCCCSEQCCCSQEENGSTEYSSLTIRCVKKATKKKPPTILIDLEI